MSWITSWAGHARAWLGRGADVLMMVGLAALTLLSRWPYRARMLYNWDAVQFALALREFDVAGYLPKPFAMDTLRSTLDRLLTKEPTEP